jgi:hypothetical protein
MGYALHSRNRDCRCNNRKDRRDSDPLFELTANLRDSKQLKESVYILGMPFQSFAGEESVLILTPVKDAIRQLSTYVEQLLKLEYPRELISIGILESDSIDGTFDYFEAAMPQLESAFRRAQLWKRDFGFHIPRGAQRWEMPFQVERRSVLAKSRNHLLFRALEDQQWVLWLDSDVCEYPRDLIQQMLAVKQEIVQAHCVFDYGGPSFDLNAWRDQGRLHMHDLREEGELVPLDSVGGTMLLVRADLHRDGLVFPPFPYGVRNPKIRTNNYWQGEIETEGLAMMASDMGVQCWGMPKLEVRHHSW